MMLTLEIAMDLWYLVYDSDYGAGPAQPQLDDVIFALDEDGPMVPGV
jgi:hypothetical protein